MNYLCVRWFVSALGQTKGLSPIPMPFANLLIAGVFGGLGANRNQARGTGREGRTKEESN